MKLLFFVFTFTIITEIYGNTNRAIIPPSSINDLLVQLQSSLNDPILFWNLVTLQACANDYDSTMVSTPEQEGPAKTTRAFAIIHGAMYNAMKSFDRSYEQLAQQSGTSQTDPVLRRFGVSAAISEAAYQALSAMYEKQRPIFDAVYRYHLNQIRNNPTAQAEINLGLTVGRLTATFILDNRAKDGSTANEQYTPLMLPGYHQLDPTTTNQGFIGTQWSKVKPFFLQSSSQFRPPNIVGNSPALRALYLNSSIYANDFNELKFYGSKTSTRRTDDQTHIGIAWAYDGAPKIGTPPRLYNQITRVIAIQEQNTLEDNARLFAFVNYAMADAGIAAWDAKYSYHFWRPIVGIRNAPNVDDRDSTWMPLGAPSDGVDNDFTPPFPAYVSGHATLGTATFESLRLFYNRDNIPFQFQSDEYNGKTKDSNTGRVRPARIRSYASLTEAERENMDSRIYLGVHWRRDVVEGQALGKHVAFEVFRKLN